MNFTENMRDSKTLPGAPRQHERLTGIKAKEVFVDRGYPGPKQIGDTQILPPKPNKNITLSRRKKHRRGTAIEPSIGHLKHDYRMLRNFLKGSFGDAINVMLAASAMNFKRMMNLWKKEAISLAQIFSVVANQLFQPISFYVQSLNFKLTF